MEPENRELWAPCKFACPIHTDVQKYVSYVSWRQYEKALDVISSVNPFPSVCGRVCTAPCEMNCRRRDVDEPLAIRALKRFVEEHGKGKPKKVKKRKKEKIAVVGAGPAGLTAAHDLALEGYMVDVFEAESHAGGMLAWGIPEYRLPRNALKRDLRRIKGIGVRIKTKHPVTSLKFGKKYDAILLAAGAQKSAPLGIPGEELEGVLPGIEFLKKSSLGKKVNIGKNVLVIGGGDTAIDSARTALRSGAEGVELLYRRSRKEMPARDEEVEDALDEGVKIRFLVSPIKIIGKDGKVVKTECVRMKLGKPGKDGRRRSVPVPNSEFGLRADTILVAIGQKPDLMIEGIPVTGKGLVNHNPKTNMTDVKSVFVAGDMAHGPWNVIEAIASGRRAAKSIMRFLGGIPSFEQGEGDELGPLPADEIGDIETMGRVKISKIPRAKRKGFLEVESAITDEDAVGEANRCLNCTTVEINPEKCALCLACVRVCPYETPKIRHDTIVLDPVRCLGCGICAPFCSGGAIRVGNPEEIKERIKGAVLASKHSKLPLVGFRCTHSTLIKPKVLCSKPVPEIIDVPCIGVVSKEDILKAFELGAVGVYLLTCSEGVCKHGLDGRLMEKRIDELRSLLEEIGIGKERLGFYDVSELNSIKSDMMNKIRR